MLNDAITAIKGIGEKKARLLYKLGLFTVGDALALLPRDYRDYSHICRCAELTEGERAAVVRISASPQVRFFGNNRSILTASGQDETGRVSIVYHNQPYRRRQIEAGASYVVTGRVERGRRGAAFVNPDMEKLDGEAETGIMPIYPLTAGVSQRTLRQLVRACLEREKDGLQQETMGEKLRLDYGLCERNFAIYNVHFPSGADELAQARRRLLTENAMRYMLVLELLARRRREQKGRAFDVDGEPDGFIKMLPFTPTAAQRAAMDDIARDMAQKSSMNRLVQGDVGSGKTAVAFFALYIAAKNGAQGVLMAPTELLARQHFELASRLFAGICDVELLVGGLSARERSAAGERIRSGRSAIVIGTHALIQQGVEFNDLAAVITDEQHRFGVGQRALLGGKGERPDALVLSATPIPRTLTLIMFGDLSVSVIGELPPGRKPVKTSIVPPHKRDDMYQYIRKRAADGAQAYVVCPLVEQSDAVDARSAQELYAELTAGALADVSVGLLHGRMAGEQKEDVLARFRSGELSVLVSTTVIEVGVDVPNAGIMVIEGAQRFGLAQLHQLRGRVGRGSEQAYCFLLTGGEEAVERLNILCSTNDGFAIAQKDLELRGPGEFLGRQQSGMGDFKYAGMVSDVELLARAQEMARRVLDDERYADIRQYEKSIAENELKRRLEGVALN